MKTVVPFRDEDLDQVRALYGRASPAITHGPWDDDLIAINEVYVAPGGCFLVVKEDRQIIGMGALRIHGDRGAEIKRMRVDPSRQRQGIGQTVFDALLQHAKSAQFRRLFLDTDARWIGAQRFYEKNDFVEYRRESWRGTTLILYERMLTDQPH